MIEWIFYGYIFFVYPIVKIIFTIGFIICINKYKKENHDNKKRVIASNYLIFIMILLYIISLVCDLLAMLDLFRNYILFMPFITSIVFLILFILSKRKKLHKKAIALIIANSIVIISLTMLYPCINGATYYFGYQKYDRNYDRNQSMIDSHNSEYEEYFGDRVSAANTKALLTRINTNNTLYMEIADSTDELIPMYVVFKTRESEEKIYTNMVEVKKQIKSSKHYVIEVYDENIATEEPELERDKDNGQILKTPREWAGYYSNGYIRTISVKEAKN